MVFGAIDKMRSKTSAMRVGGVCDSAKELRVEFSFEPHLMPRGRLTVLKTGKYSHQELVNQPVCPRPSGFTPIQLHSDCGCKYKIMRYLHSGLELDERWKHCNNIPSLQLAKLTALRAIPLNSESYSRRSILTTDAILRASIAML